MTIPVDGTKAKRNSGFIPTVEYVRPCQRIMPDEHTNNDFISSIAERYGTLELELPLKGGAALKPDADGVPALIGQLREEAPWLEPAIARLEDQLHIQLWAGRPWVSFRPMLLVGPPGCGKSSLARLIAKASGCGHFVVDVAGTADARVLEGTARGYVQAQPCFPAVAIQQAKCANPIVVVEEIDKAGGSPRNGNPKAVLLTMLERSTAAHYYDKCLLTEIDLSHVNWLLTANTTDTLPPMLLDRLDVVEVAGPGLEHFDLLLANLERDLARRWHVPVTDLPRLHPQSVALARTLFAERGSVRRLTVAVERAMVAALHTSDRKVH